jgi:hypothetical protein
MDPYLFCFVLGFLGFAIMALLGLHHSHSGAHHGHGSAHGHTPSHAHVHTSGSSSHAAPLPKFHSHGTKVFWSWLSPRALFALLLGFGGAGLLLSSLLSGPARVPASLLSAWIFKRWTVDPLWNFLFAFASTPAQTLESALLEQAQAAANFDINGQGLVALELNGHIIQMLGTLDRCDREQGIRVRSGDLLMIVAIDPQRHRCTVVRSRNQS